MENQDQFTKSELDDIWTYLGVNTLTEGQVPQLNQELYNQQPYQNQQYLPSDAHVKMENDIQANSSNPLVQSQAVIHEAQHSMWLLSLTPSSGPQNFSVSIPQTNVRNKWFYSEVIDRVYTGKDVAFPLRIAFNKGFRGSLLFHPVYSSTNNRSLQVKRCPTCKTYDPSDPYPNHIFRVDGVLCSYFRNQANHYVAQVPLYDLPPEQDMMVHVRMACRTSCPGGPNRKMFVLLVVLLDEFNQEVARDVVDIKCCESPARDMATDEKRKSKQGNAPNFNDKISDIASGLSLPKQKKRKVPVESSDEEYVDIRIPTRHKEKVLEYANLLQIKDLHDKKGT